MEKIAIERFGLVNCPYNKLSLSEKEISHMSRFTRYPRFYMTSNHFPYKFNINESVESQLQMFGEILEEYYKL